MFVSRKIESIDNEITRGQISLLVSSANKVLKDFIYAHVISALLEINLFGKINASDKYILL